MSLVVLRAALDRATYGGKAAQLGQALGAGLPVPDGFALSWGAAAAIARGEAAAPALRAGRWAVRSSAVDEDGASASFAGQHQSLLHVPGERLGPAIAQVVASGAAAGAQAYRARLGAAAEARVAVVVQEMVESRVAGVMFTRSPLGGAREIWIEASWGLGESVVQGLVTPDHWRLDPEGRLIEARPGSKDLEIVADADGGTVERAVTGRRVEEPCLGPGALAALVGLARALDRVFDGAHDVEFAFDAQDRLHLLQRREITR